VGTSTGCRGVGRNRLGHTFEDVEDLDVMPVMLSWPPRVLGKLDHLAMAAPGASADRRCAISSHRK